ncbi:two-component regulator propeller domain-containing protein [Paradesertivirga mongoliensis]|uniref:histidine kinase n=1 Tax=Paradesertivirga mongoliensis TaxID=2100740 RepID=A0ABW4ZJT2_9SPHI|nr:two-component regulator propeller domain-containing protein [Pedobacter mongoliensis]
MLIRVICTNTYLGREELLRLFGKYLIVFLILEALSHPGYTQLKANFTRYSTEDGLSHDGVLCITKDREGFMWFGTWDGINRFDGHSFTSYKSLPGDSSNLKNNKIRTIIEDKRGYLWVKTYDNLVYRFDKRKEEFVSVPGRAKEFSNLIIDRIVPASTGDTWLLTENQGLLCAMYDHTSPVPRLSRFAKNLSGDFRIAGNDINFLFEDRQQRAWIGTTTGVTCLVRKNGRYQPLLLKRKLPAFSFTSAVELGNKLYFGTATGQLIAVDNRSGSFSVITLSKGTRLNSICASRKGELYISTTGKGIITYNPQNSSAKFTALPGTDAFLSLFEDKLGQVWIEPERNGIIKYNPVKGTFKVFNQQKDANVSSPNKNYNVFEINGVLWASLKGGGFGYYNPSADEIEYFYNQPGSVQNRFSNIVTALYADPTGILWLSANDGGLNKIIFPPKAFNHQLLVANTSSRSDNEVRALLEDKSGKLWAGTKAGKLYIFKKGVLQSDVFENGDNLEIGSVYSIMESRDGTIWLGTKGNGLVTATPLDKERSQYRLEKYVFNPADKAGLSSNQVYSVLEDRAGRIWVGTLGGGLNLVMKTEGKIWFKNTANSFKNYPATCNVIRHLQLGPDGKIWVASTDGLVLFNPDAGNTDDLRFSKHNKIPGDRTSLGNNDVQYIHRDRRGQMWVGTFGGGLNKVVSVAGANKLNFRIYTRDEGLPNDIILSMVDDNKGNLWLATKNGLSQFDQSSSTFKNYDTYDGLPNAGFSEATCFRSRSGHLFFGCTTGYISFDPARISSKRLHANMALTNIQLYNEDIIPGSTGSPLSFSINNTRKITLDYDEDVISIDYTVLDYRAGHKIMYAYFLKGYDKGWHYVKNQRKATYTNLPPGNYEFIVKSTNNELFNNVPTKSIKITVLPPPWLTVWAYMAYVLLAVILIEVARRIILTMIRLRNNVAVEHRLTDLKLQFFTNISHELRTPLTLIVSPLEEITRTEQISAKGRENISIVNRNANRMIRLINQLLDFRKAQSGKMRLKVSETEMVGLLREISQYFIGLAHEKNIALEVNSNVEQLSVWIDEEKIDIVIYNLLSNAFKFSPPHKAIQIDINHRPGDEYFTITITDQGYGIPKHKLPQIFELYYEGDKSSENNLKGTGIGLALSKELIEAHHGNISASNNPEGGMIFTIKLKTGREHFKNNEVDFVNSEKPLDFVNAGYAESEADTHIIPVEKGIQSAAQQVVLLVEDNSELRKFLASQLSGYYRVLEAGDGAEGLNVASAHLPDIIVSDVMMPNMDGIQMLDQLKNTEATSHIPVILLTAKASVESQIEALKYGADFYITKPFHTDHILASVDNLIKQRKKIFESILDPDKRVVQLKPDEVLITSRDEQFLKDVIKIVEAGMEDAKFNIESVADSVGVGRTTFYKKLKSLTGFAPIEFVRDIRLKRGKQLLDSGEYTISEIAYMTGFSSLGYFGTCFKEKYKLSPSEYLRNQKDKGIKSHVE